MCCINNIRILKFYALCTIAVVSSVYLGNAIYSHYIKNNYVIALNVTTSLPDFFYIISKKASTENLKNNDILAFKFKVHKDFYYRFNHNFIKKVACTEGDKLTIRKDKTYLCNESIIGVALSNDSEGRAIENFRFDGIIPKDNYFMIGTSLNSYDSKYWGFVNKKDIIGVSIW